MSERRIDIPADESNGDSVLDRYYFYKKIAILKYDKNICIMNKRIKIEILKLRDTYCTKNE